MFLKFLLIVNQRASVLFSCLILYSIEITAGNLLIHDGISKLEDFPVKVLPSTDGSFFGTQGAIVVADPPDACFPISKPPVVNCSLNWFVLIAGNSCDVNTKLLHSQLAGYSMAILYKMEGNKTNTSKQLQDYITDIPAVIIRESYACIIQELYLYSINQNIRAFIYNFINNDLIQSCIILLIGFIFFGTAFIKVKSCRCCHRVNHELNYLQLSQFKKGDPYETCAICLEDFKIKEKLRVLPCSHGYHAKCIDKWLIMNERTCPLCKKKVLRKKESESPNSESTPLMHSTPSTIGYHSV